ncbi:hypothetical protein [Halanaerobaculum tunisiense]
MWWILGGVALIFIWLWLNQPQRLQIDLFDTYSHYLSKYRDINKKKKKKEE